MLEFVEYSCGNAPSAPTPYTAKKPLGGKFRAFRHPLTNRISNLICLLSPFVYIYFFDHRVSSVSVGLQSVARSSVSIVVVVVIVQQRPQLYPRCFHVCRLLMASDASCIHGINYAVVKSPQRLTLN